MIWDENRDETVGVKRTDENGRVNIEYVPIVCCKDCQFMYISECDPKKEMWCCARHHILAVVQPDFFCADGVRRE